MGDYSSVFTIFALMCETGCAWALDEKPVVCTKY